MAGLTFQDVMDYYKPHNQSVYQKIKKEQEGGRLRPFVGAGLSVFCGYQLWGGVLKRLMGYIPNGAPRKLAAKQIQKGEYEAAAQTIQENYPYMLEQLPELISPDQIDACPRENFQASADFLLPRLFRKGLVITTNFDQVLETVYQDCSGTPLRRVLPNQTDLLTQLRQKDALCLFKLHGDIGRDATTIDELVFTGEQYKKKYEDGSPLVEELTRHYENCRLLFLGCSLYQDRTMEVLKQLTQKQNGLLHYAILNCAKSEIPKRMKELKACGILPIFYDGKDHSAVRVILERLLEDTDREAYEKLPRSTLSAEPASKEERRLLFDADYFAFVGREKEQKALAEFCDRDDRIVWWAVTGPGGMGKSRLVYEFAKQKQNENWCVRRFEANPSKGSAAVRLEELETFRPDTAPTLIVLDDVQGHMESVQKWLKKELGSARSEKLRILLLERDGKDLDSASWLDGACVSDIPRDWCYREEFLCLQAMSDEELRAVMDRYAGASGKKLNAELLLKTLERVDPELKRPLYAIAIADARCQGKDPTNWDRTKILDTLLDRELDFHLNRLKGICKNLSKTMRSELKELLARVCLRGILPLEAFDEAAVCPILQKTRVDAKMGPEEFWEALGLLREQRLLEAELDQDGKPVGEPIEERMPAITLTFPDLIKEHLVLNLVLEKGRKELLFPAGWEQDPVRLLFMRKLLVDYSGRIGADSRFWDEYFNVSPESGFAAFLYADILWGYTSMYKGKGKRAVERLAKLYADRDRDPNIGAAYAKGLVNLSAEQALKGREETVAKLKTLFDTHPKNAEIAVQYAKGLFNLSAEQDLKGREETVAKLEALSGDHPDNAEIEELYAKGLVNLSVEQDLKGCEETVAKLKTLFDTHPKNAEIAVKYAKGLVNLSVEQDLKGREETVAKLEALSGDHPDNAEIVELYANGLVNLSAEQNLEGREETVDKLRTLFETNVDSEEIVAQYAKGLVNLSAEQGLKGREETVAKLKTFFDTHPKNAEIAVKYASGLGNLSTKQDQKGCEETVNKLKTLFDNHSDSAELASRFTGSLVSLSLIQERAAEVRQSLSRSGAVLKRFPENREIQLDYAKTWFNLTLKQAEEEIPGTVREIAAFLRANSGAIPAFRGALEKYLAEHPEHTARYQPLREL